MTWTFDDPSVRNLPALVRHRMRSPDAAFIEAADGRRFTFADFWDLAGRLAGALIEAGLGPGDRIMVQTEKSPEVLGLVLACARAGGVFVPLNTAYTLAEVERFVADAQPQAIVCAPDAAPAMRDIARRHGGPRVWTLDALGGGDLNQAAHRAEVAPDRPTRWDDLVAILYTSGTTGRSKGAMLTHGNLASNALALVEAWRFEPTDVLLHALPVYHTHGLFTASNTLLLAGGSMLFRQKFDADDVLAQLPRATAMMGVPTFYTRLLQHPGLTRAATEHIRLFVSGSAPLLAETHAEFHRRTGHAILERYGMTETNMITSNPYAGERIAGTVGRPLQGVSVRIVDPASGGRVATGEIGMVEVSGPNVCTGYWRMPEKTREEFRSDGFFITGDLGTMDAAGVVSIVGRGKDLVITGGLNVYPKEVESEIDRLPGVLESAVVGLPHHDLGEAVTAIVVLAGGAALTEAGVIEPLRPRLAGFKLPKRVFFVDELPRNAMGKVQKAALRDRFRL